VTDIARLRAAGPADDRDVGWFAERFVALEAGVERFVVGKPETVRFTLVCLLAGGHLLIDDVPGVGKTTLAKAVAASVAGTINRIQFTPDLLPSDLLGVSMWRPDPGDFVFHPGPVFANIVIADEINRASPKTQSALLEVMEEHQVTTAGVTRPVPEPFLVVATQNPTEPAGTYALPDAQLDRFLMSLSLGYPAHGDEVDIVLGRLRGNAPESGEPVADVDTVRAMAALAGRVHVSRTLADYAVSLCAASRSHPALRRGASPRASLALTTAARVLAAAERRQFATADDIRRIALPVLGHRLLLTTEAEIEGISPATVLAEVRDEVPVPAFRRA
jgi:MoxR-like ATPase